MSFPRYRNLKDSGVEWLGESAFALEPASVGPVDWLFSDIACYPARLLRLVEKWRASGLVKSGNAQVPGQTAFW